MPTPSAALPLIAPGAQVVVRDEEWLVRAVQQTPADGKLVRVIGASELVREQEATFFTELDDVQPLRPEDTTLALDPTPGFRRSRLYLEALIRKTPLPAAETRLAVGHRQLLDQLEYQRHPVKAALEALRPRLLIADAVGLGKTLEVGMVLSELMRRGRGDRILVVTPRHILEQFQHELWTRFAIPLVRLDSEGIQRVRQKIPATRNPFTYYKRVIISIDTLKNAGRYRHHLEGIRWDAVVIDECHNLVNRGTLNNQLARVLAPRTDALILTSATPHNGRGRRGLGGPPASSRGAGGGHARRGRGLRRARRRVVVPRVRAVAGQWRGAQAVPVHAAQSVPVLPPGARRDGRQPLGQAARDDGPRMGGRKRDRRAGTPRRAGRTGR